MRFLSIVLLAMVLAALPDLPATAQSASSTATGVSNTFNPAISVNGLFCGQVSRDSDLPEYNRIALQEAEAQFTAIVDPFWKANIVAAVHPAHAHEDEEAQHSEAGGVELDLEEAYIDGRSLPAGLALRLGKFYLPFGKQVPLHTHQFPFVEAPVAIQVFLGDHGLTEPGARLEATVPLPWYSNLATYAVNGDAEIFDAENRDLAFGGRWNNLWDLSTAATLELGGSYLRGPAAASWESGSHLDVYGMDLTYKWISPRRSQGPALTLQGELIFPRPQGRPGHPLGWYAEAEYRVLRNWWLGATTGQADPDLPLAAGAPEFGDGLAGRVNEYKFDVTFVPSEFSDLRAEVAYYDSETKDDLRFLVQWNFTIGSHPAHLY
jgi:hypothetical protein